MNIGYARVSTKKQNPGAQRSLLKRDGCASVFCETRSGASRKCPELDRAIGRLKPGDALVVFKIDRLARNLEHLVAIIKDVLGKGAHLRSISEGVDTRTPAGRFAVRMLGALAEFEFETIGERTEGGMQFAKRCGKPLGRRSTMTKRQVGRARRLAADHVPPDQIAAMMDVGRTTVYRALSLDYTPRRRLKRKGPSLQAKV